MIKALLSNKYVSYKIKMCKIQSTFMPKNRFTVTKFDYNDPLGWDILNFVNFENLIYMKLYSLLILTKNTKN